MNQQLTKKFAFIALDEMTKKLKAYGEKPDANQVYLQKNLSYLQAIKDYIRDLETETTNLKFNSEFFIVTEEGNSGARLKDAQAKIKKLENILELKGISITEQAYLMQDNKEITRHNSIRRAQREWSELY